MWQRKRRACLTPLCRVARGAQVLRLCHQFNQNFNMAGHRIGGLFCFACLVHYRFDIKELHDRGGRARQDLGFQLSFQMLASDVVIKAKSGSVHEEFWATKASNSCGNIKHVLILLRAVSNWILAHEFGVLRDLQNHRTVGQGLFIFWKQ